MNERGSRVGWRSDWRKRSLGDSLRETRLFLDEQAYLRAMQIAEEQQQRLPVTLGSLVEFALAMIESGEQEKPSVTPAPALLSPIAELTQAILASRFPKDTGAARFRQLAFIQIVHDENLNHGTPTVSSIAGRIGAKRPNVRELAKILQKRGIIHETHMSNVNGAPYGKVLSIAPDAVERLKAAHLMETGLPLGDTTEDDIAGASL